MKSFIVFTLVAISALQLVRGSGYSAPTKSYSYAYSTGYQGAASLTASVCADLVNNLGIQGCTDALNDYNSGYSSGDKVNCYSSCSQYVVKFVGALKVNGVLSVVADGKVQLLSGIVGVGSSGGGLLGLGGLLGGLVGGILELTEAALKGIMGVAGGVIGGLLGGVSGTLSDVVVHLNLLIHAAGTASYGTTCASSSRCSGYTAPSY